MLRFAVKYLVEVARKQARRLIWHTKYEVDIQVGKPGCSGKLDCPQRLLSGVESTQRPQHRRLK